MEIAPIFEVIMLVCFGFSWPLNVIKAYKAKTTKGTSLWFVLLIITGYVSGIIAKFIAGKYHTPMEIFVLCVYFLNLIIVSLNIVVYVRNLKLDKARAAAEAQVVETVETVENADEQ